MSRPTAVVLATTRAPTTACRPPPGYPITAPVVPDGTALSSRNGSSVSPGTLSRARSRLGSNQTTVAVARAPPVVITRCRPVPATTWALVTTRCCSTGKPLPNSNPPQPWLSIWTVAAAACLTPAVASAAGGAPAAAGGRRLAKASGKGERASRPRSCESAAGGRGATDRVHVAPDAAGDGGPELHAEARCQRVADDGHQEEHDDADQQPAQRVLGRDEQADPRRSPGPEREADQQPGVAERDHREAPPPAAHRGGRQDQQQQQVDRMEVEQHRASVPLAQEKRRGRRSRGSHRRPGEQATPHIHPNRHPNRGWPGTYDPGRICG